MTRPVARGAASARAVASFFEREAWLDTVRVCRGTSCHLLGAADVGRELGERGPCSEVRCLGYCDRSPAVLLPDGRAATGVRAARAAPGPDDERLPAIRCLASEPRVTARVLHGDHGDLGRAREAGVWRALEPALTEGPEAVLGELDRSGERGRGGAGYSTAAKWRAAAVAPGVQRYAIANGDEGDPGSFVDRVLMQHDPHAVLEGLALCGFAIGAREGIVYVRGEYPAAARSLERAIGQARSAGLLGPSVLGSAFAFDVRVVRGRGSYVCGEETALLNALEGARGEVRLRPPYPVTSGLFGAPTVVNNVETLVNVPSILSLGAAAYRRLGTPEAPGTKAMCLNAGFTRPGLVEVAFGTPLSDVIEEGGGAADGELDAVLLGGPMGSLVAGDDLATPIGYERMSACGIELGHGGVVALPAGSDWRALLLLWLDFVRKESCGRCVPCRLGSEQAHGLVREGLERRADRSSLDTLLTAMERTSLCAFGRLAPGPIRSLIERHGPEIFAE